MLASYGTIYMAPTTTIFYHVALANLHRRLLPLQTAILLGIPRVRVLVELVPVLLARAVVALQPRRIHASRGYQPRPRHFTHRFAHRPAPEVDFRRANRDVLRHRPLHDLRGPRRADDVLETRL